MDKYHKEFFDKCKSFDWFYAWSDDNRVYLAGEEKRKVLEHESTLTEKSQKIFLAWKSYNFSGESFGTPKAPKPEEKDFEDKE